MFLALGTVTTSDGVEIVKFVTDHELFIKSLTGKQNVYTF